MMVCMAGLQVFIVRFFFQVREVLFSDVKDIREGNCVEGTRAFNGYPGKGRGDKTKFENRMIANMTI